MPAAMLAEETRLVIIGDSLTAGYGVDKQSAYPALLKEALEEKGHKIDLVNGGVSGDTSASGARRINWLLKQKADILLIALGGNDGLRGIQPKSTRENIEQIIIKARKKYPDIKIILAGMQAPPNMGREYTAAFKKIYPELAKEYELSLVPFLLKNVGGHKDMNLKDGIHPNPKGHKQVMKNILPTIIKELPPQDKD